MKDYLREIVGIFSENKKFIFIFLFVLIFTFVCKFYFLQDIQLIDDRINYFIRDNIVNERLTAVMKYLTNYGDLLFFGIILIIFFIFIKDKKYSYLMFLNILFVFLVNNILKKIFLRPRPYSEIVPDITGYSFPSGHAMCSIAFYGLLIYFIHKYVNNRFIKIFVSLFLILLIIIIGFSRIYLSVHFFTDVVMGYVFGIILLILFIKLFNRTVSDK